MPSVCCVSPNVTCVPLMLCSIRCRTIVVSYPACFIPMFCLKIPCFSCWYVASFGVKSPGFKFMVWSSLHHKEADFLICNLYPNSCRSSMISGTVADWRPKSHTAAAFQLRWLTSFSSFCTQATGLSTVACGLCCIRAMVAGCACNGERSHGRR